MSENINPKQNSNAEPWREVMKEKEYEEGEEFIEGIRHQTKYNIRAEEAEKKLSSEYFSVLEKINNNEIPKSWISQDVERMKQIISEIQRSKKDQTSYKRRY